MKKQFDDETMEDLLTGIYYKNLARFQFKLSFQSLTKTPRLEQICQAEIFDKFLNRDWNKKIIYVFYKLMNKRFYTQRNYWQSLAVRLWAKIPRQFNEIQYIVQLGKKNLFCTIFFLLDGQKMDSFAQHGTISNVVFLI